MSHKGAIFAIVAGLCFFANARRMQAQQAAALAPEVREFVAVDAPVVALTHVRVVDGTGGPARSDQTIVISGGKIKIIGDAGTVSIPAGARTIDGAN
ncbi:MAG TPA: amidohydrolase, partial [Candidatus Polarisedimenticolia bacterium]|nr:amidohydrolase [Candidatus Polarisedimenticolia bacterium]